MSAVGPPAIKMVRLGERPEVRKAAIHRSVIRSADWRAIQSTQCHPQEVVLDEAGQRFNRGTVFRNIAKKFPPFRRSVCLQPGGPRRSLRNPIRCFDQAAAGAAAVFFRFAFRFLHQPSRPIEPRPLAKSGSAAGRGVVLHFSYHAKKPVNKYLLIGPQILLIN